jgi:sugar phosphate isomerase/epimerase
MKYASPLFIVKDQCEADLFAVLERLKRIGYDGVEFLGFFGKPTDQLAAKLRELGLEALGNHVDYDMFRAEPKAVIAEHKAIGCKYITITGWFGQTYEPNRFAQWVADVTEIGRMCRAEGVTLLYHNHHSEYLQKVEGQYLQDALLQAVPADALSFEPDLGWMAIAGASALACLTRYVDRCPVLHLKDYYADTTGAVPGDVMSLGGKPGRKEHAHFAFRPTGYGIMNYPALREAMIACRPEWVVMDHDLAYGRDPFVDLADSLEYAKRLFTMTP